MSIKIVLGFVFIASCASAQFSDENKRYADSLLKSVSVSQDDYKTANAYLELSEVYSLVDLDSVLFFAGKSREIATRGFKNAGDPTRKNKFITVLAGANNNMGYAYFNKGDLPNALKSHKEALDLWKKINDHKGIGQSLNNLGVVYRQLEEYNKALKFFTESLESFKKVGDKKTMAFTYNNLGGIYKMLEKDDQALECYNHALDLRKKIKDQRGVATTLNNIGALYKKQGNLDTALYFFTESLNLIEKVGDQMGIAHASCNIGEIAFARDNLPLAMQMGQRALTIGKSLGALPNIVQASGLLQRVYEKSGNWKDAYRMQSLNVETMVKMQSEDAKKAALLLEMQYEFEKQEEINHLNHEKKMAISQKQKQIQRVTIYFISFCLFIVAVFSFIVFKRFTLMREQKEIIEKQNNERKIMLQEIHHRVKNNFQIISSMLKLQTYKDDNPQIQTAFREAINRIHTMATVHEIIYKQDALDAVEARSYLENLVSHLRRTFENQKVIIDVESSNENLRIEQTIPLGIIVNELITNSFKHAFNDQDLHPKISIQLHKTGDIFTLEYKDNGVGFDPIKNKDSFGLELIETLVEQISGKMEFVSDSEWNTNFKISFIANET